MHFYWGLGLIGLCCLVALIVAVFVLRTAPWFLVWLRGSFGLGVILFSLFVVGLLVPLSAFDSLSGEAVIAELNLIEREDGTFSLAIEHSGGVNERFAIHGQWIQVSAKIMDWPKPLKLLGVQPGFTFGRLVLVDESGKAISKAYPVRVDHGALKAWDFLSVINRWFRVIKMTEFSTGPFRLRDQSYHLVSLTRLGLSVKEIPLPESADVLRVLEPAHQVPVSAELTPEPQTGAPSLEFDLESNIRP